MTGNTRANSDAHEALKETSSSDKSYENFNISAAKESIDGLPWSPPANAEGNIKSPILSQALMAIKMEDFKSIHKKPCVREALMVGIGLGFGAWGIRASLGGRFLVCNTFMSLTSSAPTFRACSWAVGTFCFGSWITFEYCQRKRRLERQALKRVVDVVDRKRTEKQMKRLEEK